MKTTKVIPQEDRDHIYDFMLNNNSYHYNLTKASEELLELSLVLLQRAHKGAKVPSADIIDEIGDVKIRLEVLSRLFPQQLIEERINKKLTMFQGYIDTEKHKNI